MATPVTRYHASSIAAHWLTVVLLVAIYTLIELHDFVPKTNALHDGMKTWHFMLGLTLFGLVGVRLVLRLVFPAPSIEPAPPAWTQRLASAMYVALYAFLIVMPLLGWLTLSAKGRVIPWFGFELPPLIGADKDLAKRIQNVHELIGTIGYYLIGLHATAALFHHYVLRDTTLLHMLPGSRNRRAPTKKLASLPEDDPGNTVAGSSSSRVVPRA